MPRSLPRSTPFAVALIALAGAACAGGGPRAPEPVSGPPPGDTAAAGPIGTPAPVAYTVPDRSPVRYSFGDTTRLEIGSGGMGAVRVLSARSGTAELTFRAAGPELQVSVSFPSLNATFQNPGRAAADADQTAITGDFRIRATAEGRVEVVDTPGLSPRLRRMVGPEALVRPFFVSLPGRAVQVGERWTDTVTVREEVEEIRTVARNIVTSTLVGDTVVEGHQALVIVTETEIELERSGTSGDVEFQERLRGTTRGRVLWDDARALLIERRESGELIGVLEMPGTPADALPVTGTVRRLVVLRP